MIAFKRVFLMRGPRPREDTTYQCQFIYLPVYANKKNS